jgi:hypothetical protein
MSHAEEAGRFDGAGAEVWNALIGPVYDAPGLKRAFGISTTTLDQLVDSKAVLRLTTADGYAAYPAFCFDENGAPVPRISEVQDRLMKNELMEPWTIGMWLNHQSAVWDGASAIELLSTDWADEVVAQAGEDRRSPLNARAEMKRQIAIARPILDRFVELVADLPVDVAEGTLFVSRETAVPYGVFAMTVTGKHRVLIPVYFQIDGDVEETARRIATDLVNEEPWERRKP